jgi:plastocyanin
MHRPPTSTLLVVLATLALVLAACGAAAEATPTEAEQPTPEATPESTPDATPSPEEDETDAAEPTDDGSGDGVEVNVGAMSFAPTQLTIPAGTEVTFNNTSQLPHTITHGTNGRAVDDAAFDRNIGEMASVTIAFDEPGTYEVTCKIHPSMNMTIVVEG